MTLNLMYITNSVEIAKIAENSGVNWIFIDLEINGKEDRQGQLDTVISRHNIEDVKKIKSVLSISELLVRVNPIFEGSESEIGRVIDDGADVVMLPFFKTKEEVETFVKIVNGRAKIMLLLETPESVKNIDEIAKVSGIDFIHIGLNDLHLGYGMKFMFELLSDGTVDMLCNKLSEMNIPYGFGGIARLGQGALPAEYIIEEHYRLQSSMVILSRSFCNVDKINSLEEARKIFNEGIFEIRSYEKKITNKNREYYMTNRKKINDKIIEIVGLTR